MDKRRNQDQGRSKIYNMLAVIGYPDNYTFSTILSPENGGTYVGNHIHILLDQMRTTINDCADSELCRTKALVSPDEMNACYSPVSNSMNILAGTMRTPCYSPDWTYAQNLGAVGAIIGHEIGHAFDANGARYDENGCFKNWWKDEDAAKFDQIKQQFIDYYAQFKVISGVTQDSALTITENMADVAGLQIVMDIVGDDPTTQREALESYASMWTMLGSEKTVTSSELLRDVHSANQVRVNAAVATLDCCYDLYGVTEEDPMYVAPEDRLRLW